MFLAQLRRGTMIAPPSPRESNDEIWRIAFSRVVVKRAGGILWADAKINRLTPKSGGGMLRSPQVVAVERGGMRDGC